MTVTTTAENPVRRPWLSGSDVMPDKVAADYLEAAAELIRTNGLHKDDLWVGHEDECTVNYDEDGLPSTYKQGAPTCSWGALYVVVGEMNRATLIGRKLILRMGLCTPENMDDYVLASWNDDEARTQEEVVDTFLRVAKDMRNEA